MATAVSMRETDDGSGVPLPLWLLYEDEVEAWLETRALEGRRIGRELLESRVRRIDADERWTVLRGGRSLGIARHWHPVLRMYIAPFTTSRTSTPRLLPPGLAGGISGAIRFHSSSVTSLG